MKHRNFQKRCLFEGSLLDNVAIPIEDNHAPKNYHSDSTSYPFPTTHADSDGAFLPLAMISRGRISNSFVR